MAMSMAGRGMAGLSALALAAAIPVAAHAGDAHVHGVGKLQVAVEGDRMTLDFYSPLDNLVGFERAPRTDKEKAAVQSMAEKLRRPEALFIPTADARCARTSVALESPAIPQSLLGAEGPAKPAGASSSADAKGAGKAPKGHAGLDAHIVFRCERPEKLAGLELKLFEAFPNLKRVDAQLAGPKKQAATKLSARNPRLTW